MTRTARRRGGRTRQPRPVAVFAIGVCLMFASYVASIAVTGLLARPRQADVAVVFGNAIAADGRPSPRLRARLDTALALYRKGTVGRVMVSGGIDP